RTLAADRRREKEKEAVREAATHERARHAWPGFREDRVHAVLPEPAQHDDEVEPALASWDRHEGHPGIAQPVRATHVGIARDEDDGALWILGAHDFGVRGGARVRVDDDAERIASLHLAHGER